MEEPILWFRNFHEVIYPKKNFHKVGRKLLCDRCFCLFCLDLSLNISVMFFLVFIAFFEYLVFTFFDPSIARERTTNSISADALKVKSIRKSFSVLQNEWFRNPFLSSLKGKERTVPGSKLGSHSSIGLES